MRDATLAKACTLIGLLTLAATYFAGVHHLRPGWSAWLSPEMLASLAAATAVLFAALIATLGGRRTPGQHLVAAVCIAACGYFTGMVWATDIGWFQGQANFGIPWGQTLAKAAVTPVLWFMGGLLAWGYMPVQVRAAEGATRREGRRAAMAMEAECPTVPEPVGP
jgi:hypothetical protein